MVKTILNKLNGARAIASAGLIALVSQLSACVQNSDAHAVNSAVAGYNRDMSTTQRGYAGWNAVSAVSGALSANASRRETQPNGNAGNQGNGNKENDLSWVGHTSGMSQDSRPRDVVYKDKLTFATGDIYEGDVMNGRAHGQGTYTWKNGGRYVGKMEDGLAEGYGVYTKGDGSVGESGYYHKDNLVASTKEEYERIVNVEREKSGTISPCPAPIPVKPADKK